MEKKVSVIVPIYNTGKRLYPCLDSLLKQTHKNLEIILINDGSKDGITKEICQEYAKKDKRIRFIDKENGGEGSARNRGLSEASGEYICFMDSDDIAEETFVESLYELQEQGAELAICGFVEERHDQTLGSGDVPVTIINATKGEVQHMDGHKAKYLLLLETAFKGYVWNKMFRKDIIEKYQLRFEESIAVWEDVLFDFIYMSRIDKVSYNPKPQYHYIYWEDSLSHNNNHILGLDKAFSAIEAGRRMEKYLTGEEQQVRKQLNIRMVQNALGVIRNIGYLKASKDTPYYGECLKIIKDLKKETMPFLSKKDKILTVVCGICPGILLKLYGLRA